MPPGEGQKQITALKNGVSGYGRLRINEILSARGTLIIFFIAAVLIRLAFMRIFYSVGSDKMALLNAAINLVNGHGLSLALAPFQDLSKTVYTHFVLWPPGYSLLVSAFLLLVPGKLFLASFFVDVVAVLLFFYYLLRLLRMIGFPAHLVPLFLIFQSVFLPDYILVSYPTDLLALSFMLGGIYYLMKVCTRAGNSVAPIAVMLFFMLAASFTRYQYFPVVCVLTGSIALAGLWMSNKRLVRAGIVSLMVLVAALAALLLYQKAASGQAYFLEQERSGFFPANLRYLYPVIPGSFYNLNFYAVQLSQLFHEPYDLWMAVYEWINWPFFLLLLWMSVRWLASRKRAELNASNIFWMNMAIASFTLIGLLALLSVLKDIHVVPGVRNWTYINEGRYYALVFVALQVLAWWKLFGEPFARGIGITILRALLVLALIIEIPHGLYLVASRIANKPSFTKLEMAQGDIRIVKQFIDSVHLHAPGKTIVAAASFEKGVIYTAGWYAVAGLYDPARLRKDSAHSSAPLVVLLCLRDFELGKYGIVLRDRQAKLVARLEDLNFYSLNIDPVK